MFALVVLELVCAWSDHGRMFPSPPKLMIGIICEPPWERGPYCPNSFLSSWSQYLPQSLSPGCRLAHSRKLIYSVAPLVTCQSARPDFVTGVELMFHLLTTMKETIRTGDSQASSGRGDGITRILSPWRTLNSGANAEAAAGRVTGVSRVGSRTWSSHFMSYRLTGS